MAPGPDAVRYCDLKENDPGCIALTSLYNKILQIQQVPKFWKTSTVILIYKKGEEADPATYRPILLYNTMYKLFTSCLARRLHSWANHEGLISQCQKGYGAGEGCYEHNFILQ